MRSLDCETERIDLVGTREGDERRTFEGRGGRGKGERQRIASLRPIRDGAHVERRRMRRNSLSLAPDCPRRVLVLVLNLINLGSSNIP
jgi:hypothetical protein